MLRSTVAAAAMVAGLAFSSTASAQSFSFSISSGPGYNRPYYGYRDNCAPRYYDQRYYGNWGGYQVDYYRRPHYDYHAYPFPHYDAHYGRHHHHGHEPVYGGYGRY